MIGNRLAGFVLALTATSVLAPRSTHASVHACTATLVSGNGQTASLNGPLSQPLVIELLGGGVAPVANEPITWTIAGPSGATGQSVIPSSLRTGADGRIQATVALGSVAGTYQVSFSSGSGGTCVQEPTPWPTFSETANNAPTLHVAINGNLDSGQFEMRPSVITSKLSPYGVGSQSMLISLACVDNAGGSVGNCNIALDFAVKAGSGGHQHFTNRPQGTVVGGGACNVLAQHVQCNGLVSGQTTLAYVSDESSGTVVANGQASAGNSSGIFSLVINVGINGLALPTITGITIDTASNNHDDNNGRSSEALADALGTMQSSFLSRLSQSSCTPSEIFINAISLPEGGLFDYESGSEWNVPHVSHRFGRDADIRVLDLTRCQKRALVLAIKDAHLTTPVRGERPVDRDASHWHIRLP